MSPFPTLRRGLRIVSLLAIWTIAPVSHDAQESPSAPAIQLLEPVSVPAATGASASPTIADPAGGPPRINPLEPVPVPQAPRVPELIFGAIEFEMPPARPPPAKSSPPRQNPGGGNRAVKEVTFTFGAVEFEMPPEPVGQLSFGAIEFEFPPQGQAQETLERLRKNVRDVLRKQKQSAKSIDRALDDLEKKKGKQAASAKRWHARGIPGGNTQVGILRSHAEAEFATYTAPSVIPGDPVVAVQVMSDSAVGDSAGLSAGAQITVLEADAVLEARWTIEETLSVTYDKTEQGPFGATVTKSHKQRTLTGSGMVRFEDRPLPGLSRAEWEEVRAAMMEHHGRRSLQAVSSTGRYGIDGRDSFSEESPRGSFGGEGRLSAQTLPAAFTPQPHLVITLRADGKNWVIEEWRVDEWKPGIRITQHTDGWGRPRQGEAYRFSESKVEPGSSVEVYPPTATPDRNPSESVTASREGSLTLQPAGEGRFSGRIKLTFRNATPEDGISTNVLTRMVTWDFELEIAEPPPSP